MLRINLLPPYIFDKQKKIQMAIIWGVIAAAVIALVIIKSAGVSSDLDAAKKQLADATDAKSQYDAYETKINDVKAKVAVTLSKETFISNAKKSNDSWPVVYEAMRDVTSPVILLQSLAVEATNHKALDFTGFAKDELTIARWWLTLRNAKNTFDSVSFNLPSHPYTPAGAQGGAGGFGMRSGFRGPTAAGIGGSPMSSSFGGSGGPPMMSSSMGSGSNMMAAKMMNASAAGMGGGFGGFGGGGGRANNASVGPAEIEGRPGLNFSGVAMVKDTLAPPAAPTWPAGGGGGAGAGMGGMMGMPGGGRMGMMGGSMPGGGMPAAAPPAAVGGGKRGGKDSGDE